jgi:N-acetylneuraminic acid mutarotase
MGKKKNKKKDAAKKEELKKKKDAKANKKLSKKARKEAKAMGEDHIDELVKQFQVLDDKKSDAVVKANVARPGPRCYPSLATLPTGDIAMFAGEYFDGRVTSMYNDLYLYTPESDSWKKVESEYSPAPRSSHQSVVYREHMYIFAGEFATTNQFYHYKDFWRYHCGTNAWELVDAKNGPSQRSGHRMVVWRNYIIVFGGFYDVSREMKFYNDVHIFCTREMRWRKFQFDSLKPQPNPRSGCGLVVHPSKDELFMYGGYTEIRIGKQTTKGRCNSDIWKLKLTPAKKFNDVKAEWNRLSRKGSAPVERNSFSCTAFKRKMVFFGGCADNDMSDQIQSDFYNDLHSYDMDMERFFKLKLRDKKAKTGKKGGGKKGKRKKAALKKESEEASVGQTEDSESSSSEGDEMDLDRILDNYEDLDDSKFYYVLDGVIMEIDMNEENYSDDEELGDTAEKGQEAGGEGAPNTDEAEGAPMEDSDVPVAPSTAPVPPAAPLASDEKAGAAVETEDTVADSKPSAAATRAEPEVETLMPRARFNSSVCVLGNELFVWGGMWEEKDRRFTLDDIWSLDLNKLEQWKERLPNSNIGMEWQGSDDEWDEVEDDDEEEGEAGLAGQSESVFEEEDDSDDSDVESDLDEETLSQMTKDQKMVYFALRQLKALQKKGELFGAKSGKRGSGGGGRRGGGDNNILSTLGLSDESSTPAQGEPLRDFFLRTADHWLQSVAGRDRSESGRVSGKELRKEAFGECEHRYLTMKPLLEKLDEMEAEQKKMEARAAASSGKELKKKKKMSREEKKALKKERKKREKNQG